MKDLGLLQLLMKVLSNRSEDFFSHSRLALGSGVEEPSSSNGDAYGGMATTSGASKKCPQFSLFSTLHFHENRTLTLTQNLCLFLFYYNSSQPITIQHEAPYRASCPIVSFPPFLRRHPKNGPLPPSLPPLRPKNNLPFLFILPPPACP